MEPQGVERRLAAILAADVAGYSRLMEADEEATVGRLSAYREVIDELVAGHRGRVFGSAGDSVIAEFASPVEAVRCAVEIQRSLGTRNAELLEERRMLFRIGVNLGDVMADGANLLGDGVNVAARLEGLAEPGGICISGKIYDEVGNKLELGFENLGERAVKNIENPVSVYRVHMDPESVPRISGAKRRRWLRAAVTSAAVALVAVAAVAVWDLYLRPSPPPAETASREAPGPALPDRPSIAVLPFTNMSDDPSQEYFTDGMTEDLITDLSKISGLFVIARNSTFAYKDKAVPIRQVGHELGVRYVLEGSVRRSGDQVRINAQLIDAATGSHIWAERYDGTLAEVFALQDEITRKIVDALAVKLASGEEARIVGKETGDATAYDVFLQGWAHYVRRTRDDFLKAVPYFKQAIKLDPDYGKAYAALASIYWEASWRYWEESWYQKAGFLSRFAMRGRSIEYLKLARQKPTPLAHRVAANLLLTQNKHEKALAEIKQGLDLDPNDPESYVAMALGLIYTGRAGEAFDQMRKARRLNPYFPAYYSYVLGLAHFSLEDYEQAAPILQEAMERNPDYLYFRVPLIAAYGHLGRSREAALIITGLNEVRGKRGVPEYNADRSWRWPYSDPKDSLRLYDGLIKGGME